MRSVRGSRTRAGQLTSEEASHEEYRYPFRLADILCTGSREKMRHSAASAGDKTRRHATPFYLDEKTYPLLTGRSLAVFRWLSLFPTRREQLAESVSGFAGDQVGGDAMRAESTADSKGRHHSIGYRGILRVDSSSLASRLWS